MEIYLRAVGHVEQIPDHRADSVELGCCYTFRTARRSPRPVKIHNMCVCVCVCVLRERKFNACVHARFHAYSFHNAGTSQDLSREP